MLVIAAVTAAVFAYALVFHEYWRDECQAALLAEDTPWTELLGALRYEGHPPLLHGLLKLASMLPRPLGLSVVGALGFATLLAGTYRWMRAFTQATPGRALIYTLIAAASYTYTYELGVIARGYGFGIGLALAGAAAAKQRTLEDPLRAFVPVLLCLTGAILASVHTACLALAIAAAFSIDALRKPDRIATLKRLAPLAACLLPAISIVLYVVRAPADRDTVWIPDFHVPAEPVADTWRLAQHAFAPEGWWEMSWVGSGVLVALLVVAILYLVFVQPPATQPLGWFLGAAVIHTLGMLALLVFRYFGEYRHHTILAIPWLLVLAAVVIAKPRAWSALVAIPLAIWQAHQLWLLFGALHRDAVQEFAQSSAVAARLPPNAHVVSTHDAFASCVSYLRPDLELRGLQAEGRRFTFTRWDHARMTRAPAPSVIAQACLGRPSVFVLVQVKDRAFTRDLPLGPSLIPTIDRRKGLTIADEYFELHQVSCETN